MSYYYQLTGKNAIKEVILYQAPFFNMREIEANKKWVGKHYTGEGSCLIEICSKPSQDLLDELIREDQFMAHETFIEFMI